MSLLLKNKADIRRAKLFKPFGTRLSTGEKNRRFQGSVRSMSISERSGLQSNGLLVG